MLLWPYKTSWSDALRTLRRICMNATSRLVNYEMPWNGCVSKWLIALVLFSTLRPVASQFRERQPMSWVRNLQAALNKSGVRVRNIKLQTNCFHCEFGKARYVSSSSHAGKSEGFHSRNACACFIRVATFLKRPHAAFGAPPSMKIKFSGRVEETGQSVAQASLEGDCLEVDQSL
jgi:hypothetical protein